MRNIKLWTSTLGVLLLLWMAAGNTREANESARSVPILDAKKAQTIYNLSKFIDWPGAVLPKEAKIFIVCLVGSVAPEFREHLSATALRKQIHGRQAVFQEVELDNTERCHVLLVGTDQKDRLEEILDSLVGRAVLTVSELEGFAERGGIVGLSQTAQRVRFSINLNSAKQANLSIRSQLLVIASLVGRTPEASENPNE